MTNFHIKLGSLTYETDGYGILSPLYSLNRLTSMKG